MSRNLQKADAKSKAGFSDLQTDRLQYAGMQRHERLRHARKRHFATAKEAAVSLGVPYGTYSGHEGGSRGFKIEELSLYARRFHVSRTWLAFGEGEPDKVPNHRMSPNPTALTARGDGSDRYHQGGYENGVNSPHTSPLPDRTYIQVETGTLRDLISGALQNENIPEEQADAYADVVLELLIGRAAASLVLRLEEASHTVAEPSTLKLGD